MANGFNPPNYGWLFGQGLYGPELPTSYAPNFVTASTPEIPSISGIDRPYRPPAQPAPVVPPLGSGLPDPFEGPELMPPQFSRVVTPPLVPGGAMGPAPIPQTGRSMPLAPPPSSRRFGAGVPLSDFIYTNPVAAQQAAASLAARLGYEQSQDEGYRRYLLGREQNQQQQAYLAQRAREAELDRNLQREGFASAERGYASRYGAVGTDWDRREAARQQELAALKLQSDRENYRRALSLAAYLNNPNIGEFEKRKQIDTSLVVQDQTGRWVPSLINPDTIPQAGSPTATPAGVPTINDLRRQLQPTTPVTPPPVPSAYVPALTAPPPPPAPAPPPAVPWYRRMLGYMAPYPYNATPR